MLEDTKISTIIKLANKLQDRKLAKQLRKSALSVLYKVSEEQGILQHFKGNPMDYKTRPHYLAERGGNSSPTLYDTGPEHEKADFTMEIADRSLSTRYSPDRVGVQARRIADGVYQDPITNKVYDWNDGFTTEDGEKFRGGRISLQSELIFDK